MAHALNRERLRQQWENALAEDGAHKDATSLVAVAARAVGSASVIAREPGIFAGAAIFALGDPWVGIGGADAPVGSEVFLVTGGDALFQGDLVLDTGNIEVQTGQFLAQFGLLATPSYSFIGDTDTGIYNTGGDYMAFVAGGVSELEVASGGVLVNNVFFHSNPASPILRSIMLINPYCESNSPRQTITAITCGMAQGTTIRVRYNARNFMGRLSSSARPRPKIT